MNKAPNHDSNSTSRLRQPLTLFAVGSLLAIGLLAGCGQSGQHHGHDHDHDHGHAHDHVPTPPTTAEAASAPYPLSTCPVGGEKLGSMGEPVVYLHEGRQIQFCCEACVKPFQENPAPYLEAIDAAIIEQEKPNYPLQSCVVTGLRLGSMGDAYPYVYRNHLVLFCCEGCVATFRKDPASHLAKIEQARPE